MKDNQLKRVRMDWAGVAREEIIEVVDEDDCITAFGSELATLRLIKHYFRIEDTTRISTGFITNLATWYFTLRIKC